MIYQDSPYNTLPHKLAEWDSKPWTTADQTKVIESVTDAIERKRGVAWVYWTTAEKMGDFMKVFREKGWDVHSHWTWYKSTYNANVVSNGLLMATEHFFIATLGESPKYFFEKLVNPTDRHNHISMTHVTVNSKDENGEAINVCEKPVPLAIKIIEMLTNATSRVLVIGSGSGSEVIAALHLGRPVVAVESDKRQWLAANNRISAFIRGKLSQVRCGGDAAFIQVQNWIQEQANEEAFVKQAHEAHRKPKKKAEAKAETDDEPMEEAKPKEVLDVEELFSQSLAIRQCCVCKQAETLTRPLVYCIHCTEFIHNKAFKPRVGDEIPPCSVTCPHCKEPGLCNEQGCTGKCPKESEANDEDTSETRTLLSLSQISPNE